MDEADQQELVKILRPDTEWTKAARRLHQLLLKVCRTVVIERNYIDYDYRAGFARLYYLRHRDTDRRCSRLHFFSRKIPPMELAILPEDINADYLGFLVLR